MVFIRVATATPRIMSAVKVADTRDVPPSMNWIVPVGIALPRNSGVTVTAKLSEAGLLEGLPELPLFSDATAPLDAWIMV